MHSTCVDWETKSVLLKARACPDPGLPTHTHTMFFAYVPMSLRSPRSEEELVDTQLDAHHRAAVDAISGRGSYDPGLRPRGRYLPYAYSDYESAKLLLAVVFDRSLYDPGPVMGGEWVPINQLPQCLAASPNPIEGDLVTSFRSKQDFGPAPALACLATAPAPTCPQAAPAPVLARPATAAAPAPVTPSLPSTSPSTCRWNGERSYSTGR